jgi:dTDP-4-dehydrorhamnose 3,5-epimerase-like enzyme
VGLVEPKGEVKWFFISDKNFRCLAIPPGWYHGYKALEPGSILMYYTDRRYDPGDEYREEIGHFGEDWETPNK